MSRLYWLDSELPLLTDLTLGGVEPGDSYPYGSGDAGIGDEGSSQSSWRLIAGGGGATGGVTKRKQPSSP